MTKVLLFYDEIKGEAFNLAAQWGVINVLVLEILPYDFMLDTKNATS